MPISGLVYLQGLNAGTRRYVQWLQEATSGYQRSLTAAGCTAMPRGAGCCGGGSFSTIGSVALRAAEPTAAAGTAAATVLPGAVQCFTMRFMSQCEHHLLPFYGDVRIGFITTVTPAAAAAAAPVRDLAAELCVVVETFTRRLQIQERITHQIAEAVFLLLGGGGVPGATMGGPPGVMVVCDASHMCMVSRGVEKFASRTTTMAVRGALVEDCALRGAVLAVLAETKRTQGS